MGTSKPVYSLKRDFMSHIPLAWQHFIAMVVIIITPFILYNTVTFGGMRLMANDTIQWRSAAQSVYESEKVNGEYSLWAPNMFSGMPAYTFIGRRSVPHIDTITRNLARGIYPVPFYWIMMTGIYLFFILQKIRPLASLLGAICIGFTSYIAIILGAGHNTKFIALSFIPWVLTGYWLITRSNKKLLSFSLLAIALTLEFRANHPQVTYYFLFLFGTWWIYDTWKAVKNKQLKKWTGISVLLVLAGGLAFLGACQNYWELNEITPYTRRGGSALTMTSGSDGMSTEAAFEWSQAPAELLTLVIPGLFGGSTSLAYWGPKPFTMGPHYLGVVAFIFFFFGIFFSRRKLKYLFLGVGTLTLLFSLGHHLMAFNRLFFEYMPYFNKFRAPEMWLIVTIFCYTAIAVYGLERLIEMAKEKNDSSKPLIAPFGLALSLGLLFYFGSDAILSYEKPGQRKELAETTAEQMNVRPSNPTLQSFTTTIINTQFKPVRREMAENDITRYLILAFIIISLTFAFYGRQISTSYFLSGLIIVACYDYISVGNRYIEPEVFVPQNTSYSAPIEKTKDPIDAFIIKNMSSGKGWSYRTYPLKDNPFHNAIPSYFYPTIGGYSGAKLSIYTDFMAHILLDKPNELNMEALSMLNVKYISSGRPLNEAGLIEVYTKNGNYLYENSRVVPKAFFVDSVFYALTPWEAIDFLKTESGFKASKMAVVEKKYPPAIQPDTTATLTITNYSAGIIEIETIRKKPGFLVLSEIYYPPGWQLTMDGFPAKIYKTNYILRGMYVPAGKHHFTMKFRPAATVWAPRVAWAANLLQWGLVIIGLILLYQRKNK